MYQHFACKVIRPSSLIALLAMRYRGEDTSLPSVKDTLLSKSEGKGEVMFQHFACKVIRGGNMKEQIEVKPLHFNKSIILIKVYLQAMAKCNKMRGFVVHPFTFPSFSHHFPIIFPSLCMLSLCLQSEKVKG